MKGYAAGDDGLYPRWTTFYKYGATGPHCTSQLCWDGYRRFMMSNNDHTVGKGPMDEAQRWQFQCLEKPDNSDGGGGSLIPRMGIMETFTDVMKKVPPSKINVKGQVRSSTTLEPIPGATVIATWTSKSGVKTEHKISKGKKGTFLFRNVDVSSASGLKLLATAEGFADYETTVTDLSSDIMVGESADLSLSPLQAPGGWTFVLTWSDESDVDIHVEDIHSGDEDYDEDKIFHVYFPRDSRRYEGHGGSKMTIDLDQDNQQGHGPETVTVEHADECKEGYDCEIVVKVNLYSAGDPTTNVRVDVNRGADGLVKRYEVALTPDGGECSPSSCFRNLFKLNAKTGAITDF